MTQYRELGPEEIVQEGDEYLSQQPDYFKDGTEGDKKDRECGEWKAVDIFVGKKSEECIGSISRRKFIFRRPIKEKTTMKSITTKPIDFAGCHPEIAEALKQGLSVRCKVWDDDNLEEICYVFCFDQEDSLYKYRVANERTNSVGWYQHAEPIKTKRVLRPAKETIPLLLENGFKFNHSNVLCIVGEEVNPEFLQNYEGQECPPDRELQDYLFMEVEE